MTVRHGSSKTPRDTSTDQRPGETLGQHKARLLAMARDLGAEAGAHWSRRALTDAIARQGKTKKARKPKAASTTEWNRAIAEGRVVKGKIITREQKAAQDAIAALRPKTLAFTVTMTECLRQEGCRCERCVARNIARQEQAEETQRLATEWKLSLVPAGQDHSNVYEDQDPYTRWNAADQPILPVRTASQLMRKWNAENDEQPESIDWAGAPAGCMETYGHLVHDALAAFGKGATIAQVKMAKLAMPEAHLRWLEKGNDAALIARVDGLITLLGDPESNAQDNYPGAPKDRWERLAGKTFNGYLAHLVVAIMSTRMGCAMTDRARAQLLNHKMTRDALHLHEYRYVSVSAVADARRKAEKDGLIRQVQQARHYRDHHRWRMAEPSIWQPLVEVPQEITEALNVLIKMTRERTVEESREKLRLAA